MKPTSNFKPDDSTMGTALPDGGSVLLNLSSELYFGLNSTGTRVWDLLKAHKSTIEIIDAIAAEHPDVERAVIEDDIQSLLVTLEEKELIVPDSSAG